jgi:hypothetical protein
MMQMEAVVHDEDDQPTDPVCQVRAREKNSPCGAAMELFSEGSAQ